MEFGWLKWWILPFHWQCLGLGSSMIIISTWLPIFMFSMGQVRWWESHDWGRSCHSLAFLCITWPLEHQPSPLECRNLVHHMSKKMAAVWHWICLHEFEVEDTKLLNIFNFLLGQRSNKSTWQMAYSIWQTVIEFIESSSHMLQVGFPSNFFWHVAEFHI